MTLFDSAGFDGHEMVMSVYDEPSGLKAIIAIHSTARGPAAGGCRMWNYATSQAALDDALRLSRAMSYKNAMAGLKLGGGKAVILGDARRDKTPALFSALGRAIESLHGKYWTAEDVGVTPQDLEGTRQETAYVAGLIGHPGASGDPSPVTADGIFRAMRLTVQRKLNKDIDKTSVAIQGVGAVGGRLADKLSAAGARLTICDINDRLAQEVGRRTGAKVVRPEAIFDVDAEVFSPCALGGALNDDTVPRLQAWVIAGGANNQLIHPEVGDYLFDKGVLFAPDYVINCGGVINVAAEIRATRAGAPYDPAWVEQKVAGMIKTLDAVLDQSDAEQRPPYEIAREVAKARIESARASAA